MLNISLVLRSSAVPGLAFLLATGFFSASFVKTKPLKLLLTIKDTMVIFAKRRRGSGLSPGHFARFELRKLQSI